MKRPIPFGKYYLLERINVGGMAEVFRGKTYGVEGFERFVAVKKILPNIAEDEEFISMFIDEAKIAVQLNHANIAQIFDLGKVDGSYFIALEYVHGKDLRAIFDRARSMGEVMPIPQACFIIMKVCEGLDYAHNKRDSGGREMHLVHRDVSPQNVLISYEGEVKIVDFGIAKAVGKASKTQAGILKGKFGYMSPEQVRGMPLDRRSDIFSVGIVLYELLTGERLFYGESDFSTLEKVRNVEILPPSTYNRRIPDELEQIVLRALARDVEDRYEYAIDLHDDLQAFMYSSGSFYSRKDLASWMKQTFSREISEENRKLDEYRQLPPPEQLASAEAEPAAAPPKVASVPSPVVQVRPPPPPLPMGGNGQRAPAVPDHPPGPPPLPPRAAPSGALGLTPVDSGVGASLMELAGAEVVTSEPRPSLTWDDDEVETQIYDKPNPEEELAMLGAVAPRPAEPARPMEVVAPVPLPKPSLPPPPIVPSPVPASREGDPLRLARVTMQVTPLPLMVGSDARKPERRSGKLGLWLAITVGVIALCGGALYYFLVLGQEPGAITVVAVPSDVTVFLDNKEQPSAGTPLTLNKLKPGSYVVSVKKPGYEAWTKLVDVQAGKTTQLEPRLNAKGTAGGTTTGGGEETPRPATIRLYSNVAGAEVFLDGVKMNGLAPMKINNIKPGRHRLEVRKPPHGPWIDEFEVGPGETLDRQAKLTAAEVTLEVNSDPPGDVVLIRKGERERKGRTPLKLTLAPGDYADTGLQVAVTAEGYAEELKVVDFEGKDAVKLDFALEKKPPIMASPTPAEVGTRPGDKGQAKPGTDKPAPAVVDKPVKPKPVAVDKPVKPKPVAVDKPVKPKPAVEDKPEPAVEDKPKPAAVDKPVKLPDEPAAATGPGKLKLGSKPWTKIIVDGVDTGFTTPRELSLPAGKHTITLVNPDFKIEKTFQITIKAGETLPPKVIVFPVPTP